MAPQGVNGLTANFIRTSDGKLLLEYSGSVPGKGVAKFMTVYEDYNALVKGLERALTQADVLVVS